MSSDPQSFIYIVSIVAEGSAISSKYREISFPMWISFIVPRKSEF